MLKKKNSCISCLFYDRSKLFMGKFGGFPKYTCNEANKTVQPNLPNKCQYYKNYIGYWLDKYFEKRRFE